MPVGDCSGGLCGFGARSRVDCVGGNGSCWNVKLLEAKRSEFHDEKLQRATWAIRLILDDIGQDSQGRTLSFVHTKMGTILAWVGHPETIADDVVTYDSPNEALARTLGLIGVGYDDPVQEPYTAA